MRKVLLLISLFCSVVIVFAQAKAPKWLDKQRKAVVMVNTYGANNASLNTGAGVFIDDKGTLLATYSIFKDAAKATVTDVDGNVLPVVSIIGADDMYDVIKVKVGVSKKVPYFNIAREPIAQGASSYLIPYSTGKKGVFSQGPIVEVTKLKDNYSYYKIKIAADKASADAPLVTENGELLGLAQPDATGSEDHIFGVSAGYINSLQVSSVDMLNRSYTSIGIKKAWPQEVEEALISLYILNTGQNPEAYLETLNDFILTFPNASEGYQSRASHYAHRRAALASSKEEEADLLQKAMADMDKSIALASNKPEAMFNKAQVVFNISRADTPPTEEAWSRESALEILQQVIKLEDSPVYRLLEGDMYFELGRFEDAYNAYTLVNNSDQVSALSYYRAAKAKENILGANIFDVLTLIDKAVEIDKDNPTAETVRYLMERIEYKTQLMMYDEAVADYDLYYEMLNGNVQDGYYYYRSQAKARQGDFSGALEDIKKALQFVPNEPTYLAEEASIYIRMEDYTSAIASLNKAIERVPDFASCHRLLGVCFLRQNNKSAACDAFHKAKEYGDPVADRLIQENCAE